MAARSTSRFKQKPAVPFGDFMLPILGVIALGIIIVGIKILWTPGSTKTAIVVQPRTTRQKAAAQPSGAGAQVPSANSGNNVSKRGALQDVTIVQPIQKSTSHREAEKNIPSINPAQRQEKAQPPAPARPEQNRNEEAAGSVKPQPVRGSIDSSVYVVQCGSYTTRASANSVVTSLKKSGYSAVVRRAEVNGKTFFRVIVAGGADRAEANEVAEVIKAAGHPVFVRHND